MKILVLLFTAILCAASSGNSCPEGDDSVVLSGESSADSTKPAPPESPGEKPSPPSLSDADVERLQKEAVYFESLEERNDLVYQDDKPYSGWVKQIHDSGRIEGLGHLKDGKQDGLWAEWHENGQKSEEATYKDGKPNGLRIGWHENGQKAHAGTFKDGEQVGLWTEWHQNGQKAEEGTYKDSEEDGPWKYWHPDGHKNCEIIFKNGEEVSSRYWNSQGKEVTEEEAEIDE